MLLPDFEEFSRLATEATLVPVAKSISADLLTPVSAFLSIAQDEPNAFLLESVEGGEKVGRYTFLGVQPYMVVSSRGNSVQIRRGKRTEQSQGDVFKTLQQLFSQHRPAQVPGLPPFNSGAVGFFAYDMVRQLEKLPSKSKDDLHLPDCVLMFFDQLLAFDHVRHQIQIIAVANVAAEAPKRAYGRALKQIEDLETRLSGGLPKRALKRRSPQRGRLKVKADTDRKHFLRDVEKVKNYIKAGDVFQAVLSQRFQLEPGVPGLEVYRALRMVNPSPYMYYLRLEGLEVLGSSPEMLVKVTGQELQYRPIAGTRPRGGDEEADQRLENELRSDEKERAEHIMLVDLGRNDLGRVSEYGSVGVKHLMFVERYSHVMHLVSALEGKLRSGYGPLDAFAACFPAGTLTGAPKVRAMEIIEELEPVRRGIYGGAIFYADFAGNLDSCIAIRTMVMKGKKAYLQAGAGIVADSTPEKEYEECVNKAAAVVRAVEKARAGNL